MDINLLFRSAMRKCGRVLSVLPKEDLGGSINAYLTGILMDETLPALDILIPYQLQISFNISDLTPISATTYSEVAPSAPAYDDRYSIYRIPKELTKGRGIMDVKSVVMGDKVSSSGTSMLDVRYSTGLNVGASLPNQMGRFSSSVPWERSALMSARIVDSLLQGQATNNFRTKFFQPNILWIKRPYGETSGLRLTACFLLKNDPSLLTIPDVSTVEVQKLFILHVKASLYNQFGHLSEGDTPYGSYNLNMSDWSGCESEANELFSQLQATAHIHNSAIKS